VDCDFCHKVTNPDDSEHPGEQFPPFLANDLGDPGSDPDKVIGYYGTGMASIWGGSDKLGPYGDAEARHQFMQSSFHRSLDFCGSCHDVSNPAVGDLAPGNGTQSTADYTVNFSGIPGGPVPDKAALNNFPHQYGVVERTFSEYKAGAISQTLISDYPGLPSDLQGGALEAIYTAAQASGTGGNYEDGTERFYSCQSCHMRPVTGKGCNKKGAPNRTDLPLHDMTGGNYWMPEAIKYLDAQGKLRLGGGLTASQIAAMDDGALRAKEQLNLAASLTVVGNKVRVVNHTGHKLISGYPEGRRMWLNIKWYEWYDSSGALPSLREDGVYGPIGVTVPNPAGGPDVEVESLVDLNDPNTKIYEAHYGMTQEWAAQLIALGYPANLALSYNRYSGEPDFTLGNLAADQAPGTYHETFHFVLNNTVVKDNRIPPYGMDYEEARKRNALPVPAGQYGGASGKPYDYFDEVSLNPPANAEYATIDLLYQPTSWEYVQFLYLANNGENPFLANEGSYMLEAWLQTGMAKPYVMATATWGTTGGGCNAPVPTLQDAVPASGQVTLTWTDGQGVAGYKVYYDQAGKSQLIEDVGLTTTFTDTGLMNGTEYCYKVTSYDATCESGFSNILCAIPNAPGQADAGVSEMETGKWVTTGKGKKQTTDFVIVAPPDVFNAGDAVVIRAYVVDSATGLPLGNEATWNTQKPNKKGQGGTTLGEYTATTINVTATGYAWDGSATSTTFNIQ
jgi:hypothetical protein